jgi:hypothetical protein
MSKAVDLTGQIFGRLTVVDRVENDKRNKTQWSCLCDCGVTKICLGSNLKSGNTTSCGCIRQETIAASRIHATRADTFLWHRYKLKPEDLKRLFDEQGGLCAICQTSLGDDRSFWHVDHDHSCCPGRSCGKCVRGVLCRECNHGLGFFRDTSSFLRAAADYLDRSSITLDISRDWGHY